MKKAILLNSSNYPYGLAMSEKLRHMANGLSINGYDSYCISMFSDLREKDFPNFNYIGKFERSIFIYTSKKQFKLSKLKRILLLPITLFREAFLFRRIFKMTTKRVFVIHYLPFWLLIWYYLIAKILKAKVVVHYLESVNELGKSFNSELFDKFSHKLSDGSVVISNKLKSDLVNKRYKKPLFILPVITNYKLFEEFNVSANVKNYILFCASAGHYDAYRFVIESFKKSEISDLKLFLVINGSESQRKRIFELFNEFGIKERVQVFSYLQYNELIQLYCNAKLLLIPLFNNEKDKARFPHKISEYLASKRPILTTNIGEIQSFFKDGINAFVENEINPESYGERINKIVMSGKLDIVGQNGYDTGFSNFDYKEQGRKLTCFFDNL